ncbi:MAG: glycoside hydrolase family 92 protein, partial [Pedobacter sp.]|nr:glycoside hydrolase family 92 protein [Pedobacter sp.]
TALYHTQIAPSIFSDANGDYRGADGKIYKAKDFTPYTVFSLWDTYRAVHPLYTLIDTKVADYANSLLAIEAQQGKMPVWHLVGNETGTMVGYHSIPVVVDAYLKGFKINKNYIWDAIKHFKSYNEHGLIDIRKQGFISADKEVWSVAKGLEYAIDSYSIAKFAQRTGEIDDYEFYLKDSKNYKNYFDKSVGFMRGKLSDGTWRKNFNPYHSIHLEDDYVEGNAWQYTWLVPHDVEGLVNSFGGKINFINKLDRLFKVKSDLNKGASIDITGMIGQYAHGNEPSHHILYLYPFVGQQWKTAEKVREVFNKFYSATPNGLIGNEDCGQMSAWYIFSALGFYPVNPVNGMFVFGSPLADNVNITLINGKQFEISALYNSADNKYIQSIKLNGKVYAKSFIMYKDILNGGSLEYTMGKTPNKAFGALKADWPVSNPKL